MNMTLKEARAYRAAIEAGSNAVERSDADALAVKSIYPVWKALIGKTVDKAGFKFPHNGDLYKPIPASHTFAEQWVPGVGTESLYTRIDEAHAGTLEDPIPYNGNMALTNGLYYSQDSAIYRCNRDTINPVYNPLIELVGLYVEKI